MPDRVQRSRKPRASAGFAFENYLPFLVNRLAIALLAYSTPVMERRALTIPQYRILMVLRENPVCNFKQVAEFTRIEPPTLSRLLNTLEDAKLVRRKRSASDTRSVLVSLTRKGSAVAEKMIPFSKSVEEMALRGVKAADARTLRRVLTQMYESVLNSPGPGHW